MRRRGDSAAGSHGGAVKRQPSQGAPEAADEVALARYLARKL